MQLQQSPHSWLLTLLPDCFHFNGNCITIKTKSDSKYDYPIFVRIPNLSQKINLLCTTYFACGTSKNQKTKSVWALLFDITLKKNKVSKLKFTYHTFKFKQWNKIVNTFPFSFNLSVKSRKNWQLVTITSTPYYFPAFDEETNGSFHYFVCSSCANKQNEHSHCCRPWYLKMERRNTKFFFKLSTLLHYRSSLPGCLNI